VERDGLVGGAQPHPLSDREHAERRIVQGPDGLRRGGQRGVGADQQTLIESWNGTARSVVPSPDVSTTGNTLLGVSCFDSTHCMAVGDAAVSTNVVQTLTESWNGVTWSVVPSPDVSTAENNTLRGVSCTGPTDCTAVGNDNTPVGAQSLVESWDGTT
jgi:hypothetical protein